MNRFRIIKTIQLMLVIVLTVASLLVVFLNHDVYTMIASDPAVRCVAVFLWVVLGISFLFLYYDFSSYAGIRRQTADLDNAVYSDTLTGVANRYSVDLYLGQFTGKALPPDMGCVTLQMTNLEEINRQHGHGGGDSAIQIFSDILKDASAGICFIGRNGGNKFLAIFRECSQDKLDHFLADVKERVDAGNSNRDLEIQYCAGTAFDEGSSVSSVTELVALSDHRAWESGKQA